MAVSACDPRRVVVQARDVVERLPPAGQEGLARFHGDLFQRLQAVGDEARAHHVDAPTPCARQRDQRRLGVRLQPVGAAEAALEGHDPVVRREAEPRGQQARGLVALGVVRIAEQSDVRSGMPWKLITSFLGPAVRLPVLRRCRRASASM